MSGVAAISFAPSQQWLLTRQSSQFLKKTGQQIHFNKKQHKQLMVNAKMTLKPASYSSKTSTDIPFFETPEASFDEYLEDKARVFAAIFPDKRRSHQLNEEEWRIQMSPIQLLILNVCPVVDMRLKCKSNGKEYPPEVPRSISKVLVLDLIRWELQGLDTDPSQFSLGVKAYIYPDRSGAQLRLKGKLQTDISFAHPPVLAFFPEDVQRGVVESVLNKLMQNMKCIVNGSLLADYSKFKRERPTECKFKLD